MRPSPKELFIKMEGEDRKLFWIWDFGFWILDLLVAKWGLGSLVLRKDFEI